MSTRRKREHKSPNRHKEWWNARSDSVQWHIEPNLRVFLGKETDYCVSWWQPNYLTECRWREREAKGRKEWRERRRTKEGGKWGRECKRRDYFRVEGKRYEDARNEKTERILEWVSETSKESSRGTISVTPREQKTGIWERRSGSEKRPEKWDEPNRESMGLREGRTSDNERMSDLEKEEKQNGTEWSVPEREGERDDVSTRRENAIDREGGERRGRDNSSRKSSTQTLESTNCGEPREDTTVSCIPPPIENG